MLNFIYSGSTFKTIGTRLFSISNKLPARFTRESIRERLKKFDANTGQNGIKGETITSHIRPDSIPVRPIKDLWKAFTFTAVVSLIFYDVINDKLS